MSHAFARDWRTPREQRSIDSSRMIETGMRVLAHEASILSGLAKTLDASFSRAATSIMECQGVLHVSGVGKAGHIARKLSATFSSTGTPSTFIHPSEALHGDAGGVRREDVLLVLSFSGESAEILAAVPVFKQLAEKLIAITRSAKSSLGMAADITLPLGEIKEACHLGLAPTASTTAMLAMGDALAVATSEQRGFAPDDFARFHPAGSLGLKLARVEQVMRPLNACRLANEGESVREVLVNKRQTGRRTGAVMIVDALGRLTGLFTDSDLAKLLESRQDATIDGPITAVMTPRPTSIQTSSKVSEAVEMLKHRKFSELPVVDDLGNPVGMIDITDVIGLASGQSAAEITPLAEEASPYPPTPVDVDVPKILPFTSERSQRS